MRVASLMTRDLFEFQKRRQLFVRTHDELAFVATVCNAITPTVRHKAPQDQPSELSLSATISSISIGEGQRGFVAVILFP